MKEEVWGLHVIFLSLYHVSHGIFRKKNLRLCTYGSLDHLHILQILFQATSHAQITTPAGEIKNVPIWPAPQHCMACSLALQPNAYKKIV